MPAWTISATSHSGTFEALGLSNPHLSRQSQALDEMTIMANGAACDGDPLFLYREPITVLYGNEVRFQGICLSSPGDGSGSAESKQYRIGGPWWHLEKCMYQQHWQAWDAEKEALAPTYDSRVILYQSALGTRLNSGDQIRAALEFAKDVKKAPILIGTIDPDLDLPWEECSELRVADVIRKALALSPDCGTYWDYATIPPTLHVRRVTSGSALTLSINDRPSFRISRRDDLVVRGVVIRYQQTHEADGQTYRSQEIDTAGDPEDLEAVFATVELAGSSVQTMFQELKCDSFPDDEDLDDVANWKKWCPDLADGAVTNLSITSCEIKAADGGPLRIYDWDRRLVLVEGQIQAWMGGITEGGDPYGVQSQEVVVACKAEYSVGTHSAFVNEVRTKTLTLTDADATHPDPDQVAEFQRWYSKMGQYSSAEPIPVGLAARLYDAWSRLQYDGRIVISAEECTTQVSPGWRLNLSDGRLEWTTMNALIVRVDEDLSNGLTTITFGPNRQVAVDDLVSMLRALRSRRVSTGWASRVSGKVSDDSRSTSIPAGTGPRREEAGGGVRETRMLILSDGSKTIRLVLGDITPSTLTIQARELQVCVDGVARTVTFLCSEAY